MRTPKPPEFWHWRNTQHGNECVIYYVLAHNGEQRWLLHDAKSKPEDWDNETMFEGFFVYSGWTPDDQRYWHHEEECPHAA
jgi:hypothetical protein